MPTYIENILTGIKIWVTNKLEEISFVTSSHLNTLHERVENIESVLANEFEESAYSERALYTTSEVEGDIMATGKMIKHRSKVSLFIKNANTVDGIQDVYYVLPYAPDVEYVNLVNNNQLHEYLGIQFKIELTTQTVDDVTYNVLKLNRYVNGSITNWETDQSVAFSLDYIAESV